MLHAAFEHDDLSSARRDLLMYSDRLDRSTEALALRVGGESLFEAARELAHRYRAS